jgi:hypothetical protein
MTPDHNYLPPLQHVQPATPVQFGLGAVFPHSNTPSLRVAGFEDSLPDVASRSFRRRGEVGRTTRTTTRASTKRLVRAGHGVEMSPGLKPRAESYSSFGT